MIYGILNKEGFKMKNISFCVLLLVLLFSVSCKKSVDLTVSEPTPIVTEKSYTGKYWICSNNNLPFLKRDYTTLMVYENKIWVIAGINKKYEEKTIYNDVWYSNNGVDWYQATSNAKFEPRFLSANFVYDDYLWVIGGMNYDYDDLYYSDVWKSNNGVDWECVTTTTSFTPRGQSGCVVFNNEMWLLGGLDINNFKNDIYKSRDGKNWIKINTGNLFSPRATNNCFIYNNEIWLIGGLGGDINNYIIYNDVWKTKDGINWTKVSDNINLPVKSLYGTLVFDGYIYLIGGSDQIEKYQTIINYFNSVYKSKDGINWILVNDNTDFEKKSTIQPFVFNNKIWIFGLFMYENIQRNEFWYSE